MKKSILTFMLVTAAIFAGAQQNYKATFATLIKSTENDFADVIGEKVDSIEGLNVYNSKVKFGIGTEALVIHIDYPKEVVYTLSIKRPESKEFEKEANEFIKTHFPASKYDVVKKAEKGSTTYTTKVYKKKNKNSILEIAFDVDKKDYIVYYGLTIYGKSAH